MYCECLLFGCFSFDLDETIMSTERKYPVRKKKKFLVSCNFLKEYDVQILNYIYNLLLYINFACIILIFLEVESLGNCYWKMCYEPQ